MIGRWQAWVVFIFAAVIAPVCASADVPVNTWSGAITGTGVLFQFNLSGASSCQVKVTGSPSGLTAAVQTSADQFGAAGWDTASATVGSASITTASNNIFNVAGSGLVGFRVNVSAYTSGTTNLWAACSSAVSHASSGTVTSVTATAPITSSGGTAPNIALTTPLATTFGGTGTASPGLVAGTNITITGSWPNNTINASGSAPAIGLTSGAGVPTASAAVGDIYRSTDGSPGETLFRYIGAYTGLPQVVNWGTGVTTATTGTFSITMQRTVVQGDLLIVMIGQNAAGFSAVSGWNAVCSSGATTPKIGAVQKQAAAGDVGGTVGGVTLSAGPTYGVALEIADFNTVTPIVSSVCAAGTQTIAVASGDLDVVMTGATTSAFNCCSVYYPGMSTYGFADTGNQGGQFISLPLVQPIIPVNQFRFGVASTGGQIIIEVGAGAGTTQLWVPFG